MKVIMLFYLFSVIVGAPKKSQEAFAEALPELFGIALPFNIYTFDI